MFAQFAQDTPLDQPTFVTPTRLAICLGLSLGVLFAWLWPQLTGLAAVAAWMIGLAIGLLSSGLISTRRDGASAWELLLGGQALGVLALVLLFVTALV